MPRLLAVCLLVLAGCSSSADDLRPSHAIEPFVVDLFVDAAAIDDVLAEADRSSTDNIVVIADIATCEPPVTWALPQPQQVRVEHYDSDPGCTLDASYRAVFLVPEQGTGPDGAWDYSDGAPPLQISAVG